jgi:hypothetical protein
VEIFWGSSVRTGVSMTARVIAQDLSGALRQIGPENVFVISSDRGGGNDSTQDNNVRVLIMRQPEFKNIFWVYDPAHFYNNSREFGRGFATT